MIYSVRGRLVYGLTYSEVWDDRNLTIEAKAIYGLLCTYAGSGDKAYPSVDIMCEKLCISQARFYKHMNLLIGAGYVKKEMVYCEGLRTNNVYTLKPNTLKNKNLQLENVSVDNLSVDNLHTNNNILNNNSINNNNNKKSRALFKAPTLEEVQQYCKERNNTVDTQSFIDFYESKGWMIGKSKMKDWKAAVRTWERRSGSYNSSTRQQSSDNPQSDSYAVYHEMYKNLKPSPDDPFQ